MAWNGPINGDYSNCDFSKPPWAAGIAVLTHEEVVFVKEQCAIIAVGHETDDFYIQSEYNKSTNYEKAINGDTYAVIKSYNPTIHTLGIDENGIVQPNEAPTDSENGEVIEQPTGEEVTEGETV